MTQAQRLILQQVYGSKIGHFPATPPHKDGWYLFGAAAHKAADYLKREGLIQIIGTASTGFTAVPAYPEITNQPQPLS